MWKQRISWKLLNQALRERKRGDEMLWDKKIKPMMAFHSSPFDSDDFIFEIKIDGLRTIAYIDSENKTVEFLNKRMSYFHDKFPEFLSLWKDVNAKRVILDGELVAFSKGKPDFSKVTGRLHTVSKSKIQILSKMHPVTFVVFDILHLDGKDLVDLPLIKRKKILEEAVSPSERIVHSVFIEEKGKKFFESIKKEKLEGIIAKKKNSLYVQERSKNWMKIKALKTLDVVIVGYTTGHGRRSDDFGSFLSAVYHNNELVFTGRIGTGLSDKQFREYIPILRKLEVYKCPLKAEPRISLPNNRKPVWIRPELVAEIKFMELTKDFQMRAPVFLRFREDKDPKDCVLDILDFNVAT